MRNASNGTTHRKRVDRALVEIALRQSRERHEFATAIKIPELDEPRTRGICGPMLADPFTFAVECGTHLTVVYMGKEILLQVSSVVQGYDVFVGEVLEIDQAFAPLGDLMVGDKVCFSRRDVHWIDVPERAIVDAKLVRGPAVEARGAG